LIWYKVEKNGTHERKTQGNTGYLRKDHIIMDKSKHINCHEKGDSTFELNIETLIKGTTFGPTYSYELLKNNRPYK